MTPVQLRRADIGVHLSVFLCSAVLATALPSRASGIVVSFGLLALLLIPFRGGWGHYMAGGVDVLVVGGVFVALAQVTTSVPPEQAAVIALSSLALFVLSLAGMAVIEREYHGQMDLRRAFTTRHTER